MAGDADGRGAVTEFSWSSGLGYRIEFAVSTVRVDEPSEIEGEVHGSVQGNGLWLLEEPGPAKAGRAPLPTGLGRRTAKALDAPSGAPCSGRFRRPPFPRHARRGRRDGTPIGLPGGAGGRMVEPDPAPR